MEVFLEDSDPDAALDVGADMRKIQHCFQKLKILVTERRSSPSSLRRGDKLSSPHLPDSTLDVESDSTPQMNKLKELLQQRDNEITILVNMLKKEKKRAQDAVTQLSTSSNGHSLSQGSLGSSGTEPAEASGRLFSGLQTRRSLAGDSPLHHRIGRHSCTLPPAVTANQWTRTVPVPRSPTHTAPDPDRGYRPGAVLDHTCTDPVLVTELKQRKSNLKLRSLFLTRSDVQFVCKSAWSLYDNLYKSQSDLPSLLYFRSYKATFGRLKGLKTEIEHLQLLLERAKVKLQRDFEVWWSEEAARLQMFSNHNSVLYSEVMERPQRSFQQRFSDFRRYKDKLKLFAGPFSADQRAVESSIQLELLDLQCCDSLCSKFVRKSPRFLQLSGF
ncbi:UNVERIFIED_CONTAM: hypothetical protein FKN15_035435 [Acipenser sinensis]